MTKAREFVACVGVLLFSGGLTACGEDAETPRQTNPSTRAQSEVAAVSRVRVVPGKALGAVRLGETRRQVETALGAGTIRGKGLRTYKQSGVKLYVTYSRSDRITGMESDSSHIELDGQPLSRGYDFFRDHTRWAHAPCHGFNLLFHHTEKPGAQTTLQWGVGGRFSYLIMGGSTGPEVSGCGA